MSHKRTLYQLPLFWVMLFAPIVLGFCVAVLIVYHDPYFVGSACWASDCINGAINRLKVPITITALIFPAVALVASQHRSAQTAAQIESADQQIEKDRDELLRKERDSALIAYSYFRQLGRVAVFLASDTYPDIKNGKGQAKQRIEEIYNGWKHANNSADCVKSMIFADNWASDQEKVKSLIDTFDVALLTARSNIYTQGEVALKVNYRDSLKILSNALDAFSRLSHLHSRDIGGLKATDLSIEIENNAKKSLDKLKDIQRRVKEASKD
jgi:hypothetical protein